MLATKVYAELDVYRQPLKNAHLKLTGTDDFGNLDIIIPRILEAAVAIRNDMPQRLYQTYHTSAISANTSTVGTVCSDRFAICHVLYIQTTVHSFIGRERYSGILIH